MISIKFDTDNAAFDGEDRGPEIARILRVLANRLEQRGGVDAGAEWTIYDINGNHVGDLVLSHRDIDEEDD